MKKQITLIAFAIFFIISCGDNDFDLDVSDIELELNIKRFDKDLFKFNIDSAAYYISKFQNEYGEFYEIYNYKIIAIGSPAGRRYSDSLYYFLKYCKDENIKKEVSEKNPDINLLSEKLTNAFKHYKYYFPEKKIPNIYTYISGFNQSVITSDSLIGISLDKYLGTENQLYNRLPFYNYQKRRMVPEMIPVDIVEAWTRAEFPYESDSDNMLDNMLYEGKIHYFINCMLPNLHDTIKWRYTTKQLNWANANEVNIWNYLTGAKLLFTTNLPEIKKYTGEGPFTVPFSKKSAPRAAVFTGYKIIKSYMDNHSKISLEMLMNEHDARKILSKAKYNPE